MNTENDQKRLALDFKAPKKLMVDYGFGWDIDKDASGNKIVQHTGDNPGYRTIIIRFLSERKTIIILNNNAHSSMRALAETLSSVKL